MSIAYQILPDHSAEVNLSLNYADYGSEFLEAVKDIRKKVNLPGFRPGTVPLDLVKARYGKDVLYEKLIAIAIQRIEEYLQQNQIQLLTNLLFHSGLKSELEPTKEKEYVVKALFIPVPEVELNTENFTIKVPEPDDEEALISYLYKFIKFNNGTRSEVHVAQRLDAFYIYELKLEACQQDGTLFDEALVSKLIEEEESYSSENDYILNMQLTFQSIDSEHLSRLLFAKEVGTSFIESFENIFEPQLIEMFFGHAFETRADDFKIIKENFLQIKVNRITEISIPEYNESFFKLISGLPIEMDEPAFHQLMKNHLYVRTNKSIEHLKREATISLLYRNHPFHIPFEILFEDFVQSRLGSAKASELTKEEIYKQFELYVGRIQLDIIQGAYYKAYFEDIDISVEKFEEFLFKQFRPQLINAAIENQLFNELDLVILSAQIDYSDEDLKTFMDMPYESNSQQHGLLIESDNEGAITYRERLDEIEQHLLMLYNRFKPELKKKENQQFVRENYELFKIEEFISHVMNNHVSFQPTTLPFRQFFSYFFIGKN